ASALDDRLHQPYRRALFPWMPAVAAAAPRARAPRGGFGGARPSPPPLTAGGRRAGAPAREAGPEATGTEGRAHPHARDTHGAALVSDIAPLSGAPCAWLRPPTQRPVLAAPAPMTEQTGVLPDRDLRDAVRDGWIVAATPLRDDQFQPASLDLRLGLVAYQLRASFLPFRESVRERLEVAANNDLVIDRVWLEHGATLQRGSVDVVPLLESLALPANVRGRSNPKSTTGRLDVFTRVITDGTPRFDEIKSGYRGPLYLEVSPQSF